MRGAPWRRVGAIALLGFAMSCGDAAEPGPFDQPREMSFSVESYAERDDVWTIGGRIGADPMETFERIQDVAFHPSEDVIAVLSENPPHLRLFDRTSGLLWAALEEGEGPGETTYAYRVGFGSSGVLVLSPRQVHWFDRAANLEGQRSIGGFLANDAASGCRPDTWVLHGEGGERRDGGVAWLWELDPEVDSLTPLFRSPPARHAIRQHPVDLRRVGDSIRFDHPYGPGPALLALDCSSGEVGELGPTAFQQKFRNTGPDPLGRDEAVEVAGIRSGSVLSIGRLDVPGVTYAGTRLEIISADSAREELRFAIPRNEGWEATSIPGSYRVEDHSRGRWVALYSSDPVPGLTMIDEEELGGAIREALAP